MANTPRACVSRSTGAFNIYSEPERINVIGLMYPGECFTLINIGDNPPVYTVYFRNASGAIRLGYIHNSMRYDSYAKWRVSNGVLVSNTPQNGYYVHTIKSGYNMNWYIGETKQASPLPGGTKLFFRNDGSINPLMTAGQNHPYRVWFDGYQTPNGYRRDIGFWIDFMTLGTLVSNRVIL